MVRNFLKIAYRLFLIVAILFLTKTANSQCCTYTLSMHDSYGDGWNGGYLQIFINHTLAGNFSASNYASTGTFQVCTGDTIDLYYTAGDWENENSYQLFDEAWNLVFADGPTPQTGNVFSGFGNCNIPSVPGNHPCNAIPIDTGQCLVADNTGSSTSGLNPGCAEYQGSDVWFKMTVPPSGNLSFETDSGGLTDTGLAIWSDTSCANIHALACDDDAGNGYFSFLTLSDLTPGQNLFIQVFGYAGGTGTFRLCVNDLGTIRLDSSELPIVRINTLNQTIPQNIKIDVLMDIKYNGPGTITYLTDPSNVYSGNAGIEIRGATSSGFPQHPYNFETRTITGANNDVSLIGMPAESDWVLISNYNDLSLIRNTLAYKLFGEMGHYSVRTHLCEVLVDSSYKGIYVLAEKIKRDSNRVDIAKLTLADTTGDELTGGYILQQNYWDANTSFQSNYSPVDHPGFDVHFVYEYPKPDVIHPLQKTYIATFVDSLETALYSTNFADTVTGYRKYMSVKSFIDYFLVNELARNADGFKKSVFFHKDKYSKGGKLKAGPVWDFDWAWKNLYGCSIVENTDGSGWAHHVNDCVTDNYSTGWYIHLLEDTVFANELRCRYESLRETILDTTYLFTYIDSVKNLVQNAQARHFQKWPILGMSGPAPEMGAIATTYNAQMDTMKYWINQRLQWLDENIPGHCYSVVTDVKEKPELNLLRYYPNPGNGNIHFEGFLQGKNSLLMTITDVSGKITDKIYLSPGSVKFDYKLNVKGVYYFTISNEAEIVQFGKLIVL